MASIRRARFIRCVRFACVAALGAGALSPAWAAQPRSAQECSPLVRSALAQGKARVQALGKGDPDAFWSAAAPELAKAASTPWEALTDARMAQMRTQVRRDQDAMAVKAAKLTDQRRVLQALDEDAKRSSDPEALLRSQKARRIFADYQQFYALAQGLLRAQADFLSCSGH